MEKIYIKDLYESVKDKPPYTEIKSHSIKKDFTPSFTQRQEMPFVPEKLKKLVLSPRIKLG
jgi:hypothetical protein